MRETTPSFKLNLMDLNVMALSSEADCRIALAELKTAATQIETDLRTGGRSPEWEEKARACLDSFYNKTDLVDIKLADVRARDAARAKKDADQAKRREIGTSGIQASALAAVTFRKVAMAILPKEEYDRINNLSEHLSSVERAQINKEADA